MARVVAVVELETDDRKILEPDISTVEAAADLRRRVMRLLTLGGAERVVAIMPVEMAKAMLGASDEAMALMKARGLMGQDEGMVRPPPDYVPPTRD